MLRHLGWAGLLAMLAIATAQAGPLDGPFRQPDVRLRPAGTDDAMAEFTVKFTGGQRACIIARGDHDPVVPLELSVFSTDGKLVARDESRKDFLAVFWVPPRTAEYKIVLRNHGAYDEYEKFEEAKKYTEVYLSFK